METLLPIRRRASQHPRRANRSPRGTRPSCTLTARPCAASEKAATTPLTNHKKNPQPRFNRNQQYSITAVSDGGGSVVERYAYSEYGEVTIADASGSEISSSAIANRYTYTGREWDEGLSLYHYRTRMYGAVGGRFVSRDPIGFEGRQWNLFEYVAAKPNTLLDPSGNRACTCDKPKDGCTKKPTIIDIKNGRTGDIGKKHVVEFQCEKKHVKIRFHWASCWYGYPYTETSYTEETCRCKWVCTLTDIGNMDWVNASFGAICDKNHALWPTEKPDEILPPDNKAKK